MLVQLDSPAAATPPVANYSHVARVEAGDAVFLFLAGQIATDNVGKPIGPGDITAQSEAIFENIQTILAAYGATMKDIIKVTTFTTDMSKRTEMATVRQRYFSDPYPISTLVEVSKLAQPEWLLEVEVVAVIQKGKE